MTTQLLPPHVQTAIDKTAQRHGVPRELVRAVAWVESRGNQQARSRTGAIGIMQLEPYVAADLGVNPHDPHENILGGTRLLRALLKRFELDEAIAAYNAGAGRVSKGRPWPAETEAYVPAVRARMDFEHARIKQAAPLSALRALSNPLRVLNQPG